MRQCINASLQRIRASSLQTIRRAIREMTEKGNPAGSGDPDGQGVAKWTNIRKISKNSIGLCRSFQKVKKTLFIIFWRFFACISVLVCTLTKKIHGNFHVPLCLLSA